MKKIIWIIIGFLFFTGCNSKNALENMNYDEFKEKIEKKETFVAYISRTGCAHCEAYEPTLIQVLKDHHLTVYKLNLATLTKAQENSVKAKVGLKGTPTLIYLEEGKSDIDGSLIGESTYENTEEFFEKIGWIEE